MKKLCFLSVGENEDDGNYYDQLLNYQQPVEKTSGNWLKHCIFLIGMILSSKFRNSGDIFLSNLKFM